MRGYDLQNVWDFDSSNDWDNWSVFRHRTSINLSIELENDVSGFIKIANQNYGEGLTRLSNDRWEEDNKSNKIFVDNAYINVDAIFTLPINIRLGRQNLMYGSGFVLLDGQSQFASTSVYFDGLKFIWKINEYTDLDALYFKDEEKYLDNKSNDDITISGVYLKCKFPIIGQSQEFYILNRDDESINKKIYMFGARLSDKLECGLDYSAEEAWDVFYGGWPQFGDLLAWKYINLGPLNIVSDYDSSYSLGSSTIGETVYSNFNVFTIGFNFLLFDKLSAKISTSQITINKTNNNLSNQLGSYFQVTANYKYTTNLSFGLYAGLLQPGNALEKNMDNANEVFWEAKLKF